MHVLLQWMALSSGMGDATAAASMPCSDLSYVRLIRTGSSACGCFLSATGTKFNASLRFLGSFCCHFVAPVLVL